MNTFSLVINLLMLIMFLGMLSHTLFKRKNWGENLFTGKVKTKDPIRFIWYILIAMNTFSLLLDTMGGEQLNLTDYCVIFTVVTLMLYVFLGVNYFKVTEKGIIISHNFILWYNLHSYEWNDNVLTLKYSLNLTTYKCTMSPIQKEQMESLLTQYFPSTKLEINTLS